MGARKPLSGEVLLGDARKFFATVPDHRNPQLIQIELKDFLMSSLAMFSLKFPSLLKFEEEMKDRRNFSHLHTIYGVERVPSDTRMREVVDEVATKNLDPLFNRLLEKAKRSGALKDFMLWNKTYLVPVDGSSYFYSDSIHCESCQEKKHRSTGEKCYSHQMLAAAIAHPNQSTVIPLKPEPIQKQDGESKNDCERNAMKRFIKSLRESQPGLAITMLTDALHATLPHLDLLEENKMSYILSVKPGSHEKLFAAMEKHEELNRMNTFVVEDEIGDKVKKKRIREYRYWNGVLLNHSDVTKTVNFLDFVETIQWVGKGGRLKEKRVHYSWITDLSLYHSSCEQIAQAGRTRWKIENEVFNSLKNHGYEFEHNFGHGYKNLTTNFAYIMMLAFLIDQLQRIGCELFQRALKKMKRLGSLWEHIRSAYLLLPFEIRSYSELLEIIIDPSQFVARREPMMT